MHIQSELLFGRLWDTPVRWRPGKSVNINSEVIFEEAHFKTASKSDLTWPTHSHWVGRGWWLLSKLHTCPALCVQTIFSQCAPSQAVARHMKV